MTREGAKVDVAGIHEFMNPRVSRHKRLAGGVAFVEVIPKNPVSGLTIRVEHECLSNFCQSGKILRKTLREVAKAEVGDSDPREARL